MKKFLAGFVVGLILAMASVGLASQHVRLIVNGEEILFPEAPPQIINGRTMVPARPLAEALGAKVDWDAETRSVIVTSEETAMQTQEVGTVPQATETSDFLDLRTIADRYLSQTAAIRQLKKNEQYFMRIEGNGQFVEMPMFGGPEISATSSSGVEVRGTFEAGLMSVSESDLRNAGIIQ